MIGDGFPAFSIPQSPLSSFLDLDGSSQEAIAPGRHVMAVDCEVLADSSLAQLARLRFPERIAGFNCKIDFLSFRASNQP